MASLTQLSNFDSIFKLWDKLSTAILEMGKAAEKTVHSALLTSPEETRYGILFAASNTSERYIR